MHVYDGILPSHEKGKLATALAWMDPGGAVRSDVSQAEKGKC